MSAMHLAWQKAISQEGEIFTALPYVHIRNFYRQSSGDNNARTLSHMLADRMTFGYVMGALAQNNIPFYEKLLALLAQGQKEERERLVREAKPEKPSLAIPLSKLNIKL